MPFMMPRDITITDTITITINVLAVKDIMQFSMYKIFSSSLLQAPWGRLF